VNYATDARWKEWSEEALRRFLDRRNIPGTNGIEGATQKSCIQTEPGPEATANMIPNSWYHPSNDALVPSTPLFGNVKQEMYDTDDTDTLFGGCTQPMALEDDIWELDTVS
jgi:hypothetical protein